MKPLLRILAVGGLLAAAHAFAADSFQGKVSLAITADKGRTQTMNYSLKGQKLRMDMEAEGQAMSSIMDMDKLEMTMLITEQKMYMVLPMKKPIEEAVAKQTDSMNTADVEVTGKTETILGYKCNQVIVKDKGTVTEVWAAEGLGAFMGLGGGGGGPFGGGRKPAAAKWEEVLKGKGGFPLRVISRDAKGKESFKMEATKIEPGSLPDSLFKPPADFQKFDMGGMFNPGG